MANILSQNEVDELLGAVERGDAIGEGENGEGGQGAQTVEEYNFRRPNLITRDQLRGFTNIHDEFSRELQSSLSIFLRTNVSLNLVSADQQQYNEFVFSLSEVTHMVLFGVDPLPGMAVLEINLPLVFGIVDLLLGGEGDVETSIRKLTEVEIAIIKPIIEMAFKRLSGAVKSVVDVTVQPGRAESSPEYVQAAPSDAPVVVLTFDAKIGLANGIINICYPLPLVQALLKELQGKAGQLDNYYGKTSPEESRRKIMTAFLDVPLPATAWLGDALIRTKDLMKLSVGDVLILNKEIMDPLDVYVSKELAFKARPGVSEGMLGVKIYKRVEHTQENVVDTLFINEDPDKLL